jgi:hypothetical protein
MKSTKHSAQALAESANRASLATDFPKIVIDQNAETSDELLKSWPLSESALDKFIRQKVESGEWERVLKRVGNRTIAAYRRKK